MTFNKAWNKLNTWLGILCLLLPACSSSTTVPAAGTNGKSKEGPATMEVLVYFTSTRRYAAGLMPFEEPVLRLVPAEVNLPEAVLVEFFKGPTPAEQEAGLEAITSGFTGLQRLDLSGQVAHVYLSGQCSSKGATYTVAQPLMVNLLQFDEISYVKIYDEQGNTENPAGAGNSIPFCLEP